jgi:hypothetical protein
LTEKDLWIPSEEMDKCLEVEMKGGCVLRSTLVEARLAPSGGKKDADKGGLSGEGGLSRNDTGGFSGDDKGELSNSEKELPDVKDDADVMADSGDDAVPPEYHFVGRGYSRSLMSARQFARERVYESVESDDSEEPLPPLVPPLH